MKSIYLKTKKWFKYCNLNNFEYVNKICEILKDDLSVKSYITINIISINKKRVCDDLLNTNDNIKTVKKKKISNDNWYK